MMASQAMSQVPGFGACPNTANAPAINVTRYIAAPFYYAKYYPDILEIGDRCSKQTFSQNSPGTLDFVISAYDILGFPKTITAHVVINAAQNGGTEYIAVKLFGITR